MKCIVCNFVYDPAMVGDIGIYRVTYFRVYLHKLIIKLFFHDIEHDSGQ